MLKVSQEGLSSSGTMMIGSFAIGSLAGEWLDIERRLEQFGEWLKIRTGNGGDNSFVNGFVTTSLVISVGAMAIVGAIQDGIFALGGSHSVCQDDRAVYDRAGSGQPDADRFGVDFLCRGEPDLGKND